MLSRHLFCLFLQVKGVSEMYAIMLADRNLHPDDTVLVMIEVSIHFHMWWWLDGALNAERRVA